MWHASFMHSAIATSSLSAVFKTVSVWSDDAHDIGDPDGRKMYRLLCVPG